MQIHQSKKEKEIVSCEGHLGVGILGECLHVAVGKLFDYWQPPNRLPYDKKNRKSKKIIFFRIISRSVIGEKIFPSNADPTISKRRRLTHYQNDTVLIKSKTTPFRYSILDYI